MATFTAIKNKAQGGGAMKGSLDYVKRKDKTLWGDRQLVTGWNCVAQSAYEEMMTTKRRYGKTDGRMFYQFVQSFSPEESVTPEEVHAIGLELAQRLFPDFEVVVATHVDTDHLHSHLIVNSVSWKDGKKLHQNATDLQRQRQISDEICAAHGLTVLEPPKKYAQEKQMRPGEYRSAVRGESWKFRLINAIDLCMRKAKTKVEFLREMENRGYQVRWEDTRKYITYTTPKGKKCRDDRLHDERYRKETMEREFRIREAMLYGGAEETEPAAGADRSADASSLSHSGTMGGTADHSKQPVPSAGSTVQYAERSAVHDVGSLRSNGEADERTAEYPSAVGTGWETERAEAFAPAQDTSAGAAHGHAQGSGPYADGLGRVGDSLIRLGHCLEQPAETAPGPAPVTGHGDRKALAKERAKKIAQGHKPNDREDQTQSQGGMTM